MSHSAFFRLCSEKNIVCDIDIVEKIKSNVLLMAFKNLADMSSQHVFADLHLTSPQHFDHYDDVC